MTITETKSEPARTAEQSTQRQFVNFMFFKADRSLRRESAELKADDATVSQQRVEFVVVLRRT